MSDATKKITITLEEVIADYRLVKTGIMDTLMSLLQEEISAKKAEEELQRTRDFFNLQLECVAKIWGTEAWKVRKIVKRAKLINDEEAVIEIEADENEIEGDSLCCIKKLYIDAFLENKLSVEELKNALYVSDTMKEILPELKALNKKSNAR